jgi:hypothetical protein
MRRLSLSEVQLLSPSAAGEYDDSIPVFERVLEVVRVRYGCRHHANGQQALPPFARKKAKDGAPDQS